MADNPELRLQCSFPETLDGFFYGAFLDLKGVIPGAFVSGSPEERRGVHVQLSGFASASFAESKAEALEHIADVMCDNFGDAQMVIVEHDDAALPATCRNVPQVMLLQAA